MSEHNQLNRAAFEKEAPLTSWSRDATDSDSPVAQHASSGTGNGASGKERRRTMRKPLRVGVEVYGYDNDLSLVHAYGTTANVSNGGLYAHVDVGLPIGARAVLVFRPIGGAMHPHILRGKVLRCSDQPAGYGIAVNFDFDINSWTVDRDEMLLSA